MKPTPLVLLLSMCLLSFSSEADAHYVKNTTSIGPEGYRDLNFKGYFTLNEKDYAMGTFQNTYSSGSATNEFKLAVGSQVDDITSYYISTYYRSEPNDIRALGIDPSLTKDYEGLILEDLSTSFTAGLMLSRYSTDIANAGPRGQTLTQSFYSYGASLQASQYLTDDVSLSIGGSYYVYTDPETDVPALKPNGGRRGQSGKQPDPNLNRRFNLVNVSDSILSTSGYPQLSLYLSADWDFLENWATSYSFSSSRSNYSNTTNYYSSLSVDHTFLKSWNVEAEYSWGSTAFTTGCVGVRYKW
jgi:hypothetical protein